MWIIMVNIEISVFLFVQYARRNVFAIIVENLFTLLCMIELKAVSLQHAKNRRKYKLLTKA